MLKGKNLSNGFWAEAINIAAYLKNRSPTTSLDLTTPFEALFGYKPVVKHLRVFGNKSFAHMPKEDRKKIESKAIKCIVVRYCIEFKAYKLFNPSTHKMFASRDIVFHDQVNDGGHASAKEEWHVPLLVEEGSDELGDNNENQHMQQQQEGKEDDVVVKKSPENDDQTRFEATPLLVPKSTSG